MDILYRIIGILLVAIVIFDVFKSVIVPRITSRRFRIAPVLIRDIVWPTYKKIALVIPSKEISDAMLETFAPLMFVVLMLTWLIVMVTGYALILFSWKDNIVPHIHNVAEAFYFAGASVLTIGYGDIVAHAPVTRFVVLTAALCGLIFMALQISFLFTLQNWLQLREQVVNTLRSRSGTPPSGLVILLRYRELKIMPVLNTSFIHWEGWVASILESHLAYPILLSFRSSHKKESWLASLGAMLDAASILLTSIDDVNVGEADLFYWLGCTTIESLCKYMDLPNKDGVHLTREEYNDGLAVLADIGYKIRNDDDAWEHFCARRAGYMGYLLALEDAYALPKHAWIHGLPLLHNDDPKAEALSVAGI